MSKSPASPRRLALAGIIAAVYAGLTLFLPIPQYGAVQLRLAEALTVLPWLIPEAVPGLAVGCFLANLLGSPFMLDWLVGTAATLLAAIWTSKLKHRALAPLPPVLCNAVIVSAEIAWLSTDGGEAFWSAYGFNFLTIGLGEAIVCFVLGGVLLRALARHPDFRRKV
ncbi:MAG: QueT transporter family protein [Oscillibacter sp.]|nr:QueT transporter family protein [Oscillibacter sp.]